MTSFDFESESRGLDCASWLSKAPEEPYRFDCDPYCQSVMDHADHQGNLSEADAEKLLADHNNSLTQALREGLAWDQHRSAKALLIHLGY